MNGELHFRDLQQFVNHVEELQTSLKDVSSINQCINNPSCGAARHKVGDTKNDFSDEEVIQILKIQVKPKIRFTKECAEKIKKQYGVTIIVPEYEV